MKLEILCIYADDPRLQVLLQSIQNYTRDSPHWPEWKGAQTIFSVVQ